jgi:hypothetical protein
VKRHDGMASLPEVELKTVLADFLAEARQELAPHPTPDELVAYHAGGLAAADEARVGDHLVLCPHCLEMLLDLGRLPDPDFGSEQRTTSVEKGAAWQALQSRLAAEAVPRETPRPRVTSRRSRWAPFLASPRTAYALAASLLVAVVGLSVRVGQLERGIAELSSPQLNAPVVDLFPASALRGGDGGGVVELGPSSRSFALILSPKGSSDFAGYRTQIIGPAGNVVWSGGGLERNRDGSFTLILSRRFLGPGEYRLRLFGVHGETRQLIEEFRMRISR